MAAPGGEEATSVPARKGQGSYRGLGMFAKWVAVMPVQRCEYLTH